jgi:ring-1,2-phenylacetyl-CoA epoxidase subunit PaaE
MQHITLTVSHISKETNEAVKITFEPHSTVKNYKAGQFLTFIIPLNGQEYRRSYSLCSSPLEPNLSVAVKRVKGGVISNYLCDQLQVGDKIEALPPFGNFTVEPMSTAKRHFVLIGAGSGITPLMSMLKTILQQEPQSRVSLIYGNRNESSIMFSQELATLQQNYVSRFKLVHVLSQPSLKWQGVSGRITAALLSELLRQLEPIDVFTVTNYYLCGPVGLMQTAIEVLERKKVAATNIHHESFGEPLKSHQATVQDSNTPIQITIINEGESCAVTVQPGQTILEAGLNAGYDLPYSCQSGVCTACRGKVKSGKVSIDEADGLSEQELEEGYVLTCVGKPLSENVIIEMG